MNPIIYSVLFTILLAALLVGILIYAIWSWLDGEYFLAVVLGSLLYISMNLIFFGSGQ